MIVEAAEDKTASKGNFLGCEEKKKTVAMAKVIVVAVDMDWIGALKCTTARSEPPTTC